MSRQRTLGAVLSGETDLFDRVVELMQGLKEEVRDTEWPIELVFGVEDGVTRTHPFIVSHQEELLQEIDGAIGAIQEAGRLYLEVLEALP